MLMWFVLCVKGDGGSIIVVAWGMRARELVPEWVGLQPSRDKGNFGQ